MKKITNKSLIEGVRFRLLYVQGNIHPHFFGPFRPRYQQANLKLGESQCLKLFLFKHNYMYLWANSKLGKTVCSEEG